MGAIFPLDALKKEASRDSMLKVTSDEAEKPRLSGPETLRSIPRDSCETEYDRSVSTLSRWDSRLDRVIYANMNRNSHHRTGKLTPVPVTVNGPACVLTDV